MCLRNKTIYGRKSTLQKKPTENTNGLTEIVTSKKLSVIVKSEKIKHAKSFAIRFESQLKAYD